jgi:hypothetical protein
LIFAACGDRARQDRPDARFTILSLSSFSSALASVIRPTNHRHDRYRRFDGDINAYFRGAVAKLSESHPKAMRADGVEIYHEGRGENSVHLPAQPAAPARVAAPMRSRVLDLEGSHM